MRSVVLAQLFTEVNDLGSTVLCLYGGHYLYGLFYSLYEVDFHSCVRCEKLRCMDNVSGVAHSEVIMLFLARCEAPNNMSWQI